MKTLIENFTQQLQTSLQIGKKTACKIPAAASYKNVVVSGLGGSGIGATIVQEYIFDKIKIPFIANKNYFIPQFVDKNTLFIACSYSGNTEETIQAVEDAKKRKATIVCICSGGALEEFAKNNKYPLFLIPSGNPPRASLGYSMLQILFILSKAKLISSSFVKEIENSIGLINKETKKIQITAQKISNQLYNKQIAIYALAGYEGLAVRFRQQLNENSKTLAWTNVIPEMTHNEIVGWKENHENMAVVYCFSKTDYERNLRRMKVLKEVTKKYKATNVDIEIKGNSFFEKAFYFIHLTDWVSVQIAELKKFDAVEVKIIDHLKATMAKK